MYNIVICEDEDIIRKGLIYSFDFNSLNTKVIADFDNGLDCLNYTQNNDVDIIITDIKMPIMDGLSLIKNLYQSKRQEFIILSGFNDFEYARQCISYEVTEYLSKPLDYELLKQSILKAISKLTQNKLYLQIEKELPIMSELNQDFKYTDEILQLSFNYIKQNYTQKIMLQDIANSINYSISTIKCHFKQNNLSFIECLNKYRLYKAIIIMKEKKLPIYEIAQKVGFSDYKYFSSTFKKYTGYTLTEFNKIS